MRGRLPPRASSRNTRERPRMPVLKQPTSAMMMSFQRGRTTGFVGVTIRYACIYPDCGSCVLFLTPNRGCKPPELPGATRLDSLFRPEKRLQDSKITTFILATRCSSKQTCGPTRMDQNDCVPRMRRTSLAMKRPIVNSVCLTLKAPVMLPSVCES